MKPLLASCVVLTNNAGDYGGGVSWVEGYNSRIQGNSARGGGGGDYHSWLYNCLLTGNTALHGGGSTAGILYNCTLTDNTAGSRGGGISASTVTNCIVYFNNAPTYTNCYISTLAFSCTAPLSTNDGPGNITNAPVFTNASLGDYQPAFGSPCIDTGTYLTGILTNDLNGNPRPMDGNGDGIAAYDMGDYEFGAALMQPTTTNGLFNLRFMTIWGQPYVIESKGSADDALPWKEEQFLVGDGLLKVISFPMNSAVGLYRLQLK